MTPEQMESEIIRLRIDIEELTLGDERRTRMFQDAARYRVLRNFVTPLSFYEKLVDITRGLPGVPPSPEYKHPGPWANLASDQSITDKIDELCDTQLPRSE